MRREITAGIRARLISDLLGGGGYQNKRPPVKGDRSKGSSTVGPGAKRPLRAATSALKRRRRREAKRRTSGRVVTSAPPLVGWRSHLFVVSREYDRRSQRPIAPRTHALRTTLCLPARL